MLKLLDEHFIVITIQKEEVLTNYLDRLIKTILSNFKQQKLTNFEDLVNLFFQYWSQYTEPLKILQMQTLLTYLAKVL